MLLSRLLESVDLPVVHGSADIPIASIHYDSRAVTPGSLFVALPGGYTDGHRFLGDSRRRGAVAAIVESGRATRETLSGFSCVVDVVDSRSALAELAVSFYSQPSTDLQLIGVTGTDGKTTTSFLLDQMLRSSGVPTGLIGTVAIRVPGQLDRSAARQTTPESLDVQRLLAEMRDAGARAAVLETTSHALATHRVDGCLYDVGLVTNVTQDHLDFHGTIERYREAKGSLLTRVAQAVSVGKQGVAILNRDDPGAVSLETYARGCNRVVWYSASGRPDADVRALDVQIGPNGSSFILRVDNEETRVNLQLPGSWNVSNALAAAAVGMINGFGINQIADGLGALEAVPGRMERVDAGQPFTVIVDYAHTPESLRKVLSEARALAGGRLIAVVGSAGERDRVKRPLLGELAVTLTDLAIFTSEDPRFESPEAIIDEIVDGAREAGAKAGVDFECIEDRVLAINRAVERAQPGDVIILAGKGHERSMIYGDQHRPWSEVEVAQAALRQLEVISKAD
jgi:UDP-N-acetylmuramoyl-L-alanyl-D-glutamate--2,6-diaminopimelate ligase